MTVSLDPLLVEVLACPLDKGPLLWFEGDAMLYNPRLHKAYRVEDGVPVLLADEAAQVDDAAHDRLMAQAAGGGVPETGSAGRVVPEPAAPGVSASSTPAAPHAEGSEGAR